MDQSFGEWYGAASVEVSDEMLRKRWAGVEQAVKELRGQLTLVKLFFGERCPMWSLQESFVNYSLI